MTGIAEKHSLQREKELLLFLDRATHWFQVQLVHLHNGEAAFGSAPAGDIVML